MVQKQEKAKQGDTEERCRNVSSCITDIETDSHIGPKVMVMFNISAVRIMLI